MGVLLFASTALFANEQQEQAAAAAALMGVGIAAVLGFFVVWIIVSIFFIMAQNKLIDAFGKTNNTPPISKVWTWTQLIPLWSIVALIMSITKFSAEYKTYVAKYGEASKPYNPTWGWIVIGSWAVSLVFGLAGIVMFAFWIVYWVNIAGATKAIEEKAQAAPQQNESAAS